MIFSQSYHLTISCCYRENVHDRGCTCLGSLDPVAATDTIIFYLRCITTGAKASKAADSAFSVTANNSPM